MLEIFFGNIPVDRMTNLHLPDSVYPSMTNCPVQLDPVDCPANSMLSVYRQASYLPMDKKPCPRWCVKDDKYGCLCGTEHATNSPVSPVFGLSWTWVIVIILVLAVIIYVVYVYYIDASDDSSKSK